MARGVRPGTPLRFSLNKRPLENMSDLLDRVEKYLRAEEDSTLSHQEENHSRQKRQDHLEGKNQDEPKRPRAILPKPFTPLNTTREHILHQIKGLDILKWPKPMRGLAKKRDTQLYYHFHKDHGHTTEECKVFQREIKNLIAKGYLKQFVKNNQPQNGGRNPPRRANEAPPKDPPMIKTISGGPSAGGLSSSSRKAYARQVNLTQGPPKRAKAPASLEFNDSDLEGVSLPHDDALVITLRIDAFQASPPLLSKPVPGDELFLYLAVAESTVSAVLVWEEAARQLPIYYVSKILQGAEQRYPDTEKLAFALLMAARKLRPYFQSHTIVVLTDKPLRQILHKPDLSGRLVPWSVELGEFDIQYRPRLSIKGQALADFIVKCTLPIEDEAVIPTPQSELFVWTLFVDGSSNANGSGAGLILNRPDSLIQDAMSYTKKCDACQRFSPIPRQTPSPLSALSSPIPFVMWGIDILGPFPPTTAQHKFVIVVIDYFTKWVEAEALATITEKKCEDFFWRAVVCHFGIPRVLITDNVKQFDNPTFRAFCSNLSIEQRFTSVAHPQTNGQIEVTNQTLLQGIKKKLDGVKGLWVEELPKILLAYNTTTRTPTGETPLSLSFGIEALIPIEIGLPYLRLTTYDPVQNAQALHANLDLLDERYEQAAMRLAAYQHRVSKFYDRQVRPRMFRVGDLVLHRIEASAPLDAIGKLASNWEGPYKVVKLGGPGTYHLEAMDDKAIPRTWNATNLRRYYA
ncbi:hypothetical protein RJ639_022920 [Escallonia herrerae]|uniref:Integrase catalytic domain-containing protein n=1 Tax=Escallonia herrerae TaxID=1293975 RepID=A0AA88UZW8_9ASTE|nr:hypothetical protein RJ639_022920 [Escallonia herrerae]